VPRRPVVAAGRDDGRRRARRMKIVPKREAKRCAE